MNLLLKHLDVNLGHCNIFSSYNMPKPVRLQRRTVLHYELDFFLESEGGVEVDGVYLPFAKSEVNFRKPGQIVQGLGRYHCYCMYFSFDAFEASKVSPVEKPVPKRSSPDVLYDVMNHVPDKITGSKAEQIGLSIQKIYQYYLCDEVLLVKSELLRLLHELLTFHQNTSVSYNEYVKKSITYMNTHYQEEIHFEDLSKHIGISKPYFFDLFKQCTGTTPNQFLTRLRIDKAKYLLISTNMPIKDVGYECGFDDNVYFSYLFRKETGVSPSAFRTRERHFPQ
ncbi:MAG: helix-turn-helix transcriptional regulator [Lachnospiraceae bacterium]|nr:helix-turn-helix transcriptional regulator [Lachnospiraceae bacterium]